jgi:phytanoyl-CoA hydroxylase
MNAPATKTLPPNQIDVQPSAAQVRSFVDDGFAWAPGLVSAAEIAELKADMLKLARGGYPCEQLKPARPGATDQEVLEGILCIHQPHFISPVMRRFCSHPGITSVLSRIVGAHLAHWDGAVKCMQSMLFVKGPNKPGQAWHQDERYIPTRDRSLCGAWIALDDATIANGCLWVVPGSHRQGYIYPLHKPDDLDEYDGADEAHGFDLAKAVPVEVPAGSVVFFNGYLLHKSLRNRTQGYRRVLVNHYMNAWSLLPWYQVEGQGSVGVADNRTVFGVAGTDPYAWKGTQEAPQSVYLRSWGKAFT